MSSTKNSENNVNRYEFDIHELTEILIKQKNIHEGIYQLRMDFRIASGLLAPAEDTKKLPGLMFGLCGVVIEQAKEPNDYTIDAAKINPKPKTPSRTKKSS